MANYYIKYNFTEKNDCPWEVWFGSDRVSRHITKFLAYEECDLKNEILKKSKFSS